MVGNYTLTFVNLSSHPLRFKLPVATTASEKERGVSLPNTLFPTKNLEPRCLKFPVFPIPRQPGSAFLGHPVRPPVSESVGNLNRPRSRR
jgi:hypothetical protein